jgi:predicted house-cleaning NTP pyrophosphatase (Maf/HAM1 superfamily)
MISSLVRMEILEQINVAPRVYALTVKEVVRRQEFTSHFAKVIRTLASSSRLSK